jgi:hypothetical protein
MNEAMIFMTAVCILLPLAIVAVIIGVVLQRRSAERQALIANGEPAEGRVLEIEQTGTSLNDSIEVRMQLEVHLPGRAPYRTEYTTFVSLLAIPRVQPGCTLQLRVARANPTWVAALGL